MRKNKLLIVSIMLMILILSMVMMVSCKDKDSSEDKGESLPPQEEKYDLSNITAKAYLDKMVDLFESKESVEVNAWSRTNSILKSSLQIKMSGNSFKFDNQFEGINLGMILEGEDVKFYQDNEKDGLEYATLKNSKEFFKEKKDALKELLIDNFPPSESAYIDVEKNLIVVDNQEITPKEDGLIIHSISKNTDSNDYYYEHESYMEIINIGSTTDITIPENAKLNENLVGDCSKPILQIIQLASEGDSDLFAGIDASDLKANLTFLSDEIKTNNNYTIDLGSEGFVFQDGNKRFVKSYNESFMQIEEDKLVSYDRTNIVIGKFQQKIVAETEGATQLAALQEEELTILNTLIQNYDTYKFEKDETQDKNIWKAKQGNLTVEILKNGLNISVANQNIKFSQINSTKVTMPTNYLPIVVPSDPPVEPTQIEPLFNREDAKASLEKALGILKGDKSFKTARIIINKDAICYEDNQRIFTYNYNYKVGININNYGVSNIIEYKNDFTSMSGKSSFMTMKDNILGSKIKNIESLLKEDLKIKVIEDTVEYTQYQVNNHKIKIYDDEIYWDNELLVGDYDNLDILLYYIKL